MGNANASNILSDSFYQATLDSAQWTMMDPIVVKYMLFSLVLFRKMLHDIV